MYLHSSQRVAKQLVNAQTKLSQTQQRAADKKAANARHMDNLQAEYDKMDVERKENDVQVAELRKEADEIEEKVSVPIRNIVSLFPHSRFSTVSFSNRWPNI